MNWVNALDALLADLAADETLAGLAGFQILRRGEFTEPVVPSIAWQVVSDTAEENTNPVRVQIDLFAHGLPEALTIERRLRARHSDLPQAIQGVEMWCRIDDARDHEDPAIGVTHRSLDFVLEPARERIPT